MIYLCFIIKSYIHRQHSTISLCQTVHGSFHLDIHKICENNENTTVYINVMHDITLRTGGAFL